MGRLLRVDACLDNIAHQRVTARHVSVSGLDQKGHKCEHVFVIVAVWIPSLALRVALNAARKPFDALIALGPQPGATQVVGECTPAAAAQGVREGLSVGEALARCPTLELVSADPDAVSRARERVTTSLEGIGAAVEVGEDDWCFEGRGLERLYGGLDGVLRKARASIWVGADPRLGVAMTRFVAIQAAHEALSKQPRVITLGEEAAFLAPLPAECLPLDRRALEALANLGIDRVGRFADLPARSVLDRFGPAGHHAWGLARGEDGRPLRPRTPPQDVEATMRFPESVGALAAIEESARILLHELSDTAIARGRAFRSLTLRAGLEGGGSWTHTLALREATADPERLTVASLPHLARVAAPVEWIAIRGDASGALDGHQLVLTDTGGEERRRRTDEAARQVQSGSGRDAVMRLVELEPWSRLPERRWALVPFTGSPSLKPSR
jgi:protein ImuB